MVSNSQVRIENADLKAEVLKLQKHKVRTAEEWHEYWQSRIDTLQDALKCVF